MATQSELFDDLEPTKEEKTRAKNKSDEEKTLKEQGKLEREADAKRSALKQRPMISSEGNVFKGATASDYTPQEKAIARSIENKEYADKRVKASPIVAEAEIAKLKEMASKMGKGSGGGGGGMDGPMGKSGKMLKSNYKAGGTVRSSASKRADGIATKGKTRGRIC